jgi:dienelactone hydrolase
MPATQAVHIPAGRVTLDGDLTMPPAPAGLVVFAHGSGSSRNSPRNRMVAEVLNAAGFATLLADLLTPAEEERDRSTGNIRFDIPLLGERVTALVDWAAAEAELARIPLGIFGASTGAAAALRAAAARGARVSAVVSRGGRPDLARDVAPLVKAATLLIVGARDGVVLHLNEQVLPLLGGERELVIVRGASHLFEEPGALEDVAHHAREWFLQYLRREAVGARAADPIR